MTIMMIIITILTVVMMILMIMMMASMMTMMMMMMMVTMTMTTMMMMIITILIIVMMMMIMIIMMIVMKMIVMIMMMMMVIVVDYTNSITKQVSDKNILLFLVVSCNNNIKIMMIIRTTMIMKIMIHKHCKESHFMMGSWLEYALPIAALLYRPPVDSLHEGPMMRSFGVVIDVCMNNSMNKQHNCSELGRHKSQVVLL